MKQQKTFNSPVAEALIYPALLIVLCWTIWLLEYFQHPELVHLGIRPRTWSSWSGLFFMPLIHDPSSIKHILNNSIPTYLLLASLIFYYREIAFKILTFSWIGTGFFVWVFAQDMGSYHIGMSGVIYALFGFLFLSGMLRRVKALQGISLVVIFVYGSMIWGIFPTEPGISWEGHLGGLLVGLFLAVVFRKLGPKPAKFQYEIEKEMGIEPPDLEGQWIRNQEELAMRREMERIEQERIQQAYQVIYHYVPKTPTDSEETPPDGIEK